MHVKSSCWHIPIAATIVVYRFIVSMNIKVSLFVVIETLEPGMQEVNNYYSGSFIF